MYSLPSLPICCYLNYTPSMFKKDKYINFQGIQKQGEMIGKLTLVKFKNRILKDLVPKGPGLQYFFFFTSGKRQRIVEFFYLPATLSCPPRNQDSLPC